MIQNPQAIIARETGIAERHVAATLALLADGATIPFISRYRKEVTGGLDETQIFAVSQRANELDELEKRRLYIIKTIDEQGKLTPELKQRIEDTLDPALLEDIYLPYKPKRRTRAQVARENGLEPLAFAILADNRLPLRRTAAQYVGEKVESTETALQGAADIIAETVSEDETSRSRVRDQFRRFAHVTSKVIKGKEEEGQNYASYFNFDKPLDRCSSHAYLAMRRGEAEGVLRVSIGVDDDKTVSRLLPLWLRRSATAEVAEFITDAVTDGYKRLIRPSIENEFAAEYKVKADDGAIAIFTDNLRQLLLGSPLGAKATMGVDPGFRTGCKVVCLDANGNLLDHTVIYPTPPRNYIVDATRTVLRLIEKYNIEAIAVGNGTAGRETEQFLKSLSYPHPVEVFSVNENGASVYSASKVARDEFPDYDVTVRGAVSIGRRLMDPLAELVKIDPKAIGVGQYQHDVDQNRLRAALDMTVSTCVNQVGVDVNTASLQLLTYVSGIGPTLAANIVAYRADNGDFTSRDELRQVPRMGPKAYEQAAGFLRLPNAENILDRTAVHPERYALVARMAADLGLSTEQFIANPANFAHVDADRYFDDITGQATISDIFHELEKPGRDPREKAHTWDFDSTIHELADVRAGMILPGIVNNITDFGAFVDIGVHESGLIHVSQMAERRINHPSQVLKLHQHIMVKVLEVDEKRRRISLTIKGVPQQ